MVHVYEFSAYQLTITAVPAKTLCNISCSNRLFVTSLKQLRKNPTFKQMNSAANYLIQYWPIIHLHNEIQPAIIPCTYRLSLQLPYGWSYKSQTVSTCLPHHHAIFSKMSSSCSSFINIIFYLSVALSILHIMFLTKFKPRTAWIRIEMLISIFG